MRLRRSGRAEVREVALSRGNLAGLLDPVLAERALQAIDNWSDDAQAGVAPVILVLRMARPLLGQSEAADVADAAVDDRDLAMIAVVQPAEVADAQRVEFADHDSSVVHQLLELVVHLVTAGRVDEQTNLDALSRFGRERVRQPVADLALPPDVRLDVHALVRATDVTQEKREEFVAVLEELDLITGIETGLRQADDR